MKQNRIFIQLLVVAQAIFLLACGNPFNGGSKKIFHKRILLDSLEIQWYYYSLISNTSPDFIEVIQNDTSTIICQSNSLINVDYFDHKIIVRFGDTPQLYQPVSLPSEVFNIPIIKDTSEVGKRYIKVGDNYFLRSTFKTGDTIGINK